jgi:hypothetical protein
MGLTGPGVPMPLARSMHCPEIERFERPLGSREGSRSTSGCGNLDPHDADGNRISFPPQANLLRV